MEFFEKELYANVKEVRACGKGANAATRRTAGRKTGRKTHTHPSAAVARALAGVHGRAHAAAPTLHCVLCVCAWQMELEPGQKQVVKGLQHVHLHNPPYILRCAISDGVPQGLASDVP